MSPTWLGSSRSNMRSISASVEGVLNSRYRYAAKVRNDILKVTKEYPALIPKLETYIFNDGNSKELVCLHGTMPVRYQGKTYNMPVRIWVLDTHPYHAPLCYVCPTATMEIKVSQYVYESGQINLPYLHEWKRNSSELYSLVKAMIMVLGETPPVFTRSPGTASKGGTGSCSRPGGNTEEHVRLSLLSATDRKQAESSGRARPTTMSTNVKDLFEKMQFSEDQLEKPTIVQQWLAKHEGVVESFVREPTQPSGSRTKVTTACGLQYEAVCSDTDRLQSVLSHAAEAQTSWRDKAPEDKTRALYAVARNFQKHVTLFGTAEAVSFPFKRLERCRNACATYAVEYLYSAAARRNFTTMTPRYTALLVVQTTDFGPMNLVAEWQIGEALSAHTPVVLAVPPSKCLPALIFAEICHIAGLPPGLLNVLILPDATLASLASPGPDVMLLRLQTTRPHVSTSIIAEGADIPSAVNGTIEMLCDYWGMPNYLGTVVYVQDCIEERVLKVLEAQVGSLEVAKLNFAKTADIIAQDCPKIVKASHFPSKPVPKEPTLFVQGFRTIKEVASLASTGPLHSECLSVWTEYVGRAVEVAERVAGFRNIWINGHNHFDIDLAWFKELHFPSGKPDFSEKIHHTVPAVPDVSVEHVPSNIDRTLKLYYGGAQKRAESQSCYPVYNRFPPFDRGDKILAYVPAAGAKDARNAVEAALKAFPGWSTKSAFNRSQIMYFFGENLSQRRAHLVEKLSLNTGHSDCAQELQESIDAVFKWASHCGTHAPSFTSSSGMKVYSTYEPHGVIAIVCPPVKAMRSLITLLVSAISIGNTVVIVVPEEYPIAPLMLAQVIETSDIPDGVINILSGPTDVLLATLAGHHDVKALWCWANRRTATYDRACENSCKRSVWWFNISSQKSTEVWPDDELDFYRGARRYVWLPCSSIFAN